MQTANAVSPPHERIRAWSVWPDRDFPRTVLGKADRQGIAQRIRLAPANALSSPTRPTSLAACVLDPDPRRRIDGLVSWFATHRDEPVAESLRTHGVDSIEVLQVLSRLEVEQQVVLEDRVDDVHAPFWPFTPTLDPIRTLVRRTLVDPILALTARIDVVGREHLTHVDHRTFFALAGEDRIDRLDFLRIYRALPPRLRRRLMFLLASNTIFTWQNRDLPLWYRLYVQSVFHFAMPLFIPFTLFPKLSEAGTAEGLRHACVCIDRGFTPLTSWGRGTAIMASECQLSVVPVRLQATKQGRVTVTFRPPIPPDPTRPSAVLHALVDQA